MPHVELPHAEFKVVMLGDTNTGKTSLVLRFAEGYYRESGRNATVGAFFVTKRMSVQGLTCKIQIWDTAGQEQFKRLAPMYYKNAAAAVICYDVSSPGSFDTLKYWVDELQTKSNIPKEGRVLALCATKCDLGATMTDTYQAETLAKEIGAIFCKTSAKDNVNVSEIFEMVAANVLNIKQQEDGPAIPVTLGNTPEDMQMRGSSPASPASQLQDKSPQTGNSAHRSKECFDADEKKNDDHNDIVENMDSKDTMESKCDPTSFMCGDAEEMMGGAGGKGCVIQ